MTRQADANVAGPDVADALSCRDRDDPCEAVDPSPLRREVELAAIFGDVLEQLGHLSGVDHMPGVGDVAGRVARERAPMLDAAKDEDERRPVNSASIAVSSERAATIAKATRAVLRQLCGRCEVENDECPVASPVLVCKIDHLQGVCKHAEGRWCANTPALNFLLTQPRSRASGRGGPGTVMQRATSRLDH